MISERDIQYKTVLFVTNQQANCISVINGELLITDIEGKTITKIAFPKILAIFMVGKFTITTPVLDLLQKHAIPFCIMKQSLRPLLWKANMAEGNYLLRQKQFTYSKQNLTAAKALMREKLGNQKRLMERIPSCERNLKKISLLQEAALRTQSYEELMNTEAVAASLFFNDWFRPIGWKGRKPRMKNDEINVALDIGYTILFNFVEANLRLFGFDLYVGVYHRLFFQRKSLVCDIMEPFRCIIDKETLESFKSKMFRKAHFERKNEQLYLKKGKEAIYWRQYIEAVVNRKMDIFRFIRNYYKIFMKESPTEEYPTFEI